MLEFWFDSKIPVERKFILLAVLALSTAGLYLLAPLELSAILMFLGTGLIFLICRYCNMHFIQTQNFLARLLHWIPIALLMALIFMQFKHGDILILGAQGIGFMALAVCIFSPFSLVNLKDQ